MHNWKNEVEYWKYSTWAKCDFQNPAALPAGNLTGIDLSNTNLAGLTLAGRTIQNCSFKGANLEGVNLKGAVLKNCSFRGATLNGVNLKKTKIFSCCFRETTIKNCDLSWVTIKKCSFWQASIEGRFFDEFYDENTCSFYASEIKDSCFEGARIKSVDFRFTSFRGGSFIGATLKNTLFSSDTLTEEDGLKF